MSAGIKYIFKTLLQDSPFKVCHMETSASTSISWHKLAALVKSAGESRRFSRKNPRPSALRSPLLFPSGTNQRPHISNANLPRLHQWAPCVQRESGKLDGHSNSNQARTGSLLSAVFSWRLGRLPQSAVSDRVLVSYPCLREKHQSSSASDWTQNSSETVFFSPESFLQSLCSAFLSVGGLDSEIPRIQANFFFSLKLKLSNYLRVNLHWPGRLRASARIVPLILNAIAPHLKFASRSVCVIVAGSMCK